MLQNRRSTGNRKVSPPEPTCMTDDQKATYLANLRTNRPARPGGARPLPSRPGTADLQGTSSLPRSGSAFSIRGDDSVEDGGKRHSIPNSNSLSAIPSFKGRPLVHAPSIAASHRDAVKSAELPQQPGLLKYQETLLRDQERKEAHSLREALDKIDHVDEETRVYAAAQKEAADLVWKHLNPQLAEFEKTSAYRNPDLSKNRKHQLQEPQIKDHQHSRMDSTNSVSSLISGFEDCKVEGLRLPKRGSKDDGNAPQTPTHQNTRRRSNEKRITSSSSNKGCFRNPDDQIYEEPEEMDSAVLNQAPIQEFALQTRPHNSLPRGSRPLPEKPCSLPVTLPERLKYDMFEMHRNPRVQSHNAEYTANATTSREGTPEVETPKGRAMEIRSDEIRAATSMKRKDRSPKLPTPTAVSDRPGRPIVSFDPSWRAGNESPKTSMDIERSPSKQVPPLPTTSHSAPIVPTINLPDDDVPIIKLPNEEDLIPSISVSEAPLIPTINLPGESQSSTHNIPSISFPDDTPTRPVSRVHTSPNSKPLTRPLPSHTQSSPAKLPPNISSKNNRVPWLSRHPAGVGATVTCNACKLPIAGRIVTASGSIQGGPKARFHPECFTCSHCSTALECVSFYPEPESSRNERIEQDQAADPSEMRFFCHLDFHDLFSPRCASCKTPIEGSVIIAAGKSWHEGHFFCAECGDPFSSTSPFVEDKGYAYCVGCHTKRTSSRCRACKKQILDEVSIEALGGKWHEECFRCDECAGDFGEDGRFFIREVEVELTDKEKRKGAFSKKFEDRAVCHRCEELRLRRADTFL